MKGIISLISGFSIGNIIDGRVSLAHLIEFNNFVELYVLEENILLDESSEIYYKEFNSFQNSPIIFIQDKSISDCIGEISDRNRAIYDFSPQKNFTFSFESYDYWVNRNVYERKLIANSIIEKREAFIAQHGWLEGYKLLSNKDMLDYEAYNIDLEIIKILEKVGKTDYALTPSTRNLLPFLESFHQIETPTQFLYKSIVSQHKDKVIKLLEFQRPRMIYIPPLLSILLSRCSSAKDIPIRLSELRFEYSDLRKEISTLLMEMNTKRSLKEQIEIREAFDNTMINNSKKYEEKQLGFYKNLSGALLDAFDDGNLEDIIFKPAVALAKEGLNYLPDLFQSKRLTGFISLLNNSFEVYDYQNLLHKVFGNKLDISQYEMTELKRYYSFIKEKYRLDNYYKIG